MERKKVTINTIFEKKAKGIPITAITAHDTPTAQLIDQSDVDMVLVGDSIGMLFLGYKNTLPITMDEITRHLKAVRRGVQKAFLVADMPFGAYKVDMKESLKNAVRLVKEGGAEAVKIEGGLEVVELVKRLIDLQIPVKGHIGLTPQSYNIFGGYKIQGKTISEAERLLEEALALEAAGCFSVSLEGVPDLTAKMITSKLQIPTIGIGAGPYVDGQGIVFNDIVGYGFGGKPKFAKQYVNTFELMKKGLDQYCEEVRNGTFPDEEHSYKASEEFAKNVKKKL